MNKDADVIRICDGLKLRWSGIFNLGELYKNMQLWLEYSGYGDPEKTFREEKYVEKIRGNTKEIHVKWKGEKFVSDYFSFIIEVNFRILGLSDVEVQQDGRKIKANKGDVTIIISADFVTNRQGKWSNDSFLKKAYENLIVRDRIERYKIDLYEKAYNFHDEIKSYLNLNKMG